MEVNVDGWEIYEERIRSRYVVLEDGKIKIIGEKYDSGKALRVIKNGRCAMVSGKVIDNMMMERAVKIARISEERLDDFPARKRLNRPRVYGVRLDDFDESRMKDIGEAMETEGVSSAYFSVEEIVRRIENSSGVDYEEKESYAGVIVEAVVDGGNAYEYCESRRFDFDPEDFVERAIELAIIDSRAEKVESGKYTVTLSPIAVDQLLTFSLYPAFYRENIKKGRSVLADLMGEKVMGELTLIDDPVIDYGINSCSFDDEGVRTEKKVLVERGVIKGSISDLIHSDGNPTGNGFREDYSSYPAISPTNVVLDFPETGEAEGVYVHAFTGAHTANFVSGDFSLKLMNASIDGKGIKGAMIYGNVYEFLKKISHIGKEVRQIGYTITPEIVLEGIEIKI